MARIIIFNNDTLVLNMALMFIIIKLVYLNMDNRLMWIISDTVKIISLLCGYLSINIAPK